MSNPSMKKPDILASLIIVPICLYVFYESGRWPVEATIGSPTLIPRGVAVCVIFAALMLFVRALTGRALPLESKLQGKDLQRVAAVVLLTGAYVLLVERVGFMITTFFYMFLFALVLGERRWHRLVFFAVAVPVVVYAVFDTILNVPLPRGFFR